MVICRKAMEFSPTPPPPCIPRSSQTLQKPSCEQYSPFLLWWKRANVSWEVIRKAPRLHSMNEQEASVTWKLVLSTLFSGFSWVPSFWSSISPCFILRLGWVEFWRLSIYLVAENISKAWEDAYPRIQNSNLMVQKMQVFMKYVDVHIMPSCGKE